MGCSPGGSLDGSTAPRSPSSPQQASSPCRPDPRPSPPLTGVYCPGVREQMLTLSRFDVTAPYVSPANRPRTIDSCSRSIPTLRPRADTPSLPAPTTSPLANQSLRHLCCLLCSLPSRTGTGTGTLITRVLITSRTVVTSQALRQVALPALPGQLAQLVHPARPLAPEGD